MWADSSSRPVLGLAGREEGMHVQQHTILDIKQERKRQFPQLCSHVKTVYLQVEAAFLVLKKDRGD